MEDPSLATTRSLFRVAEILVKTRDELRETIDKVEHLRKVVDSCANTLIDTLKEALLIAYADASTSDEDGDELEQPVVERSSTQGEDSVGPDSKHEERDEI